MLNNFVEFKNEIDSLEQEIFEFYNSKNEIKRKLISDGIVNIEEYYNSNIKIMWILKEPRDGKNSTGGGWSIVENLKDVRSKGLNKDSPQTFLPIIYTTFALLNDIKNYSQLETKKVYTDYSKCLNNIAYINIQKLPANSNSKNKEVEKAYEVDKEIILKQIQAINPDVIISCVGNNIFMNLKKDLNIEFVNKKKFINSYHPAQISIKRTEYVNRILKNYYS